MNEGVHRLLDHPSRRWFNRPFRHCPITYRWLIVHAAHGCLEKGKLSQRREESISYCFSITQLNFNCAILTKVDSNSIPNPGQRCSLQFWFQFHSRKYWFDSIPSPIPSCNFSLRLDFNSNSMFPKSPWNPIPIPESELHIIYVFVFFLDLGIFWSIHVACWIYHTSHGNLACNVSHNSALCLCMPSHECRKMDIRKIHQVADI